MASVTAVLAAATSAANNTEAVWQRCYVYFLRNTLDYVPGGRSTMIACSESATDRGHVRQAQGLAGIHTRYDRCAYTFMSAIAIAATVIFWL